jgi:hypothetical protein
MLEQQELLYLFPNLDPYSYLKPQTWELNPLPLLLQAHLRSFLHLAPWVGSLLFSDLEFANPTYLPH